MIPEREREALMRLTMCAREECGMCKYEETCDFDFQYETATRCMNILADTLRTADRKTESQTETPYDDCQKCMHWVYDGYWYCECNECNYEPKTEPNSSGKPNNCEDEPQTDVKTMSCYGCKHRPMGADICDDPCHCHYEPQTDCVWK